MAKKKLLSNKKITEMSHSQLLELIDDQIYKHLPINKLVEIVDKRIEEASSKILSDVNDKINLRICSHLWCAIPYLKLRLFVVFYICLHI